jgi:hypothetical protein
LLALGYLIKRESKVLRLNVTYGYFVAQRDKIRSATFDLGLIHDNETGRDAHGCSLSFLSVMARVNGAVCSLIIFAG